jgi:hypothetical protein
MNHPMMPRRRALVQLLATTALAVSAATVVALPGVARAASGTDDTTNARPMLRPANAVVHWNSVALDAFAPIHGTDSISQSRVFAILQAAVHDAVNAIDRRYATYTPAVPSAPYASVDAAVAAAAHDVLVALLPPGQAPLVEAAYERALKAIPDGGAKTSGVATGQASARANLARRANDGASGAGEPVYVPTSQPGDYQFTEPFDFAFLPGWGRVQPFVIKLNEHRLEGPLALGSAAYAKDLAEVKAIGQVDSTTRSAEQTEIARFWYEDSPLGWNRIANTTAQQRKLDEWDAARTFALVNFAMADGFIAGFAEKYEHRFWRPVTAIRAAGNDGNARTEPDTTWQPLMVTPPVPDYPSTHTVLGWAAAEVLTELFGDRMQYETSSLTLPGTVRSFKGFSQAAQENGDSRVYAGIHFRHAVKDGRRQGRSVGKAVAQALPALMP